MKNEFKELMETSIKKSVEEFLAGVEELKSFTIKVELNWKKKKDS